MKKNTKSKMNDVLDFITGLESGDFSRELAQAEDPNFQPIIDKLNTAAKILGAKSAQATLLSGSNDITQKRISLQSVFENYPSKVFILDIDGRYLIVNQAFLKEYGITNAEAVIGKTVFELFPKEEAALFRKNQLEVISTLRPKHIEELIPTTNGKRWNSVTLFPIQNSTGDLEFIGGTILDIHESKIAGDQLLEQRNKLKQIIDSSPAIFYTCKATGDFGATFIAPSIARMGYTPEDFTSDSSFWKNNIHLEDKEKVLSGLAILLIEGTHCHEYRFKIKDGSYIWLRDHLSLIKNINNEPTEIIGFWQDISKEKAEEDELKHIFSHSMDLMCIASTDGTFKKISPSFTKILGHDENELISKPFMDFIHPDDLAATEKIVETLNQGIPIINFENRYRTRVGTYRLISWVCEPDRMTGLLYATGRDITQQRALENKNKEILNAINSTAIIAFTDATGKITEVNDNFCKISGYSREELLGNNHRILNSKAHSQKFFAEMWAEIKKGKVWCNDIENRSKNGDHYFVRTVITPLKGVNGEIQKFMSIRFDITEQMKTIRLLEVERAKSIRNSKLASLGEMSAGIAHEINNPLAIISGSVNLLPKFLDNPEKLQSKIDIIEKSCKRISKIVAGLKKFSRSGDKTQYLPKSLLEIVNEAVFLTELKSKQHNTPVSLNCQTHASINCDEVEIEQVLVNLINNAIDAVKVMPEKWVQIQIFEENSQIVLKVMDSGPGIPENIRAKLFDPFFTTKQIGEGTGLGLSITKGILDEHKATITLLVDSPKTCFEIRFPKVNDLKNVA